MALLSPRVHPTLTASHLDLSPFALDCLDLAAQREGPSLSTSQTLTDKSKSTQLSLDTASTVSSGHAVSDFERISYYNGIASDGDHPDLLYRTGSAKYPWTRPTGRHASLPVKSARGVFGTPLNKVWGTVGPQICDLVKQKTKFSSISTARFVTERDGEETLGPVTIWISVPPGSTSADIAHDISEAILALLVENGVEGVEVEWTEGVVQRL